MFVFTVKSGLKSKKAKVILCATAVVLCLFIVFTCVSVADYTPKSKASINGFGEYSTVVETEEQAKQFAQQFYEVEQLYTLYEVYVPITFNDRYEQYNQLQKAQGLDLEPYKGEKCRLYMYLLADFEIENEQAFMSVMVYRDRVIGGDISSLKDGTQWYTFSGEQVQ